MYGVVPWLYFILFLLSDVVWWGTPCISCCILRLVCVVFVVCLVRTALYFVGSACCCCSEPSTGDYSPPPLLPFSWVWISNLAST